MIHNHLQPTVAVAIAILMTMSLLVPRVQGGSVLSSHPSTAADSQILILDDSGLAQWPGSGTEENPYVIAGLTINGHDFCITVMNTRAHFIIRDCTLIGGRTAVIELCNVTGGVISNNTIQLGTAGIQITNSTDVTVDSNRIAVCGTGVWAISSLRSTIRKNQIHHNTQGIVLDNCNESSVVGDWLFGNSRYGVALYNAHHNQIYDNSIGWNGYSEAGDSETNAYDSGTYNLWDDGKGTGNRWHDWTPGNEYDIPGPASSSDRAPRQLVDDTPPEVSGQREIIIEANDSGLAKIIVTWTVHDHFPKRYRVIVNGAIFAPAVLVNDTVRYRVVRHGLGEVNITILVEDWEGNSSHHTVMVVVVPPAPSLDQWAIMAGSLATMAGVAGIVLLMKRRS